MQLRNQAILRWIGFRPVFTNLPVTIEASMFDIGRLIWARLWMDGPVLAIGRQSQHQRGEQICGIELRSLRK